MDQDALFEGYEADPDPLEGLSADARRTLRYRQLIEQGIHPLTRQTTHPERGTCGDCRFRKTGVYPKCTRDPVRQTHSAATDCRAWWPACHQHEPKET